MTALERLADVPRRPQAGRLQRRPKIGIDSRVSQHVPPSECPFSRSRGQGDH